MLRRSLNAAIVIMLLMILSHGLAAAYSFTSFPENATNPYGTFVRSGNTLYGVACCSGPFRDGAIYSFNIPSNSIAILHYFSGYPSDGDNPQGSLTLSNNTLYGMTEYGGSSDDGTIFSFNTASNTLTILHSFSGTSSDGSQPVYGNLTLSGTTLYGMTFQGGAFNQGTIFSFNTISNTLTILHSFSGTSSDGSQPYGSLTLSNNTLYGMTSQGGNGFGTIFSFNTISNTFATLYSFPSNELDGVNPLGSLTISGNLLYGMTPSYGPSGYGTIFSFNTASNTLTTLYGFSGYPSDGSQPYGSLTLSNNTLYGMTHNGGSSNDGTIFSFNTISNTLTILHSFSGTSSDGSQPYGSLTFSGNTLYGMTNLGGSSNAGAVFDINTTGSNFAILDSFIPNPNGEIPQYGSLTFSGNTLYGMTLGGGAFNDGTIFSVNITTNTITILHSFSSYPSDGSLPYGSLTLSGNTLYGMTNQGGSSNDGTIFSFNITTNTITILHSFSGGPSDGLYPYGSSLILSNNTLYGMTREGGSSYDGIIFSINTGGSGYSILQNFNGVNGAQPYGSLTLSGDILYGMTQQGGLSEDGTIFSFNTASNTLTILHSFSGTSSDGSQPYGSLILSGDILYGMTQQGGLSEDGTIFSFNTASNTLTILHSFSGTSSDGSYPYGSLILSNNTLYGMTSQGGSHYGGTIFSINTEGSVYSILQNFNGVNGEAPYGSLTLSNNTLYGMTEFGGSSGSGTIFSLGLDYLSATPNPYTLTHNTIKIGQSSSAKTVISNGLAPYYATWYWSMANVIAENTSVAYLPVSNNTLTLGINATSQYRITLTYNGVSYIIDANHSVIVKSLQSLDTNLGGIAPDSSSLIRFGNTLYGLTSRGGIANQDCGTLISININGTDLETLHNFYDYGLGSDSPCEPEGSLTLSNNTLYGMTYEGGKYGYGTVFSIRTNGYNFTILHNFTDNDSDGAHPIYGNLTLSGNTLYGMTSEGGADNDGIVFSIRASGSDFTLLHSFTDSSGDGADPYGSLLMINGVLYGMTYEGGVDNYGTVFSITTHGAFTLFHSFSDSGSDGARPLDSLTHSGTTLYGMTSAGGTPGYGIIFSIKTNGNSFTTLHDFSGGASNGAYPYGTLTISGNTLYGMTISGGTSNEGTIFSIATSGLRFNILHSFTGNCNNCTDGANPQAGALYLYNNTLYGMTQEGGEDGDVFSIGTDGSNFVSLANLESAYYGAIYPEGSLTASGNTLYGFSNEGGAGGYGAIYEIHTNTTGFGILASFDKYNGAFPEGSPTVSNGTIYGMTNYDGVYGCGTIFSLTLGSSAITVLHNFGYNGTDGCYPQYGNLTLLGTTLYGMTYSGGTDDEGTIFSINTNGSGYRILHNFNGLNGAYPNDSLTLSGDTLYGMTTIGGADDDGTIFSINKNGSDYAIVHNFTCSTMDGCTPFESSLAISSNTLYGSTTSGGTVGAGVVFSIKTDGSEFTILHSFYNATDDYAYYPYTTPTIYEGDLYGTTSGTDFIGDGMVYFMDLNGSNFAVIHVLDLASDNYSYESYASLTIANGTLYGITENGGNYNHGGIYSIKDLGPETIYGVWTFNASVGDSVGDINPAPPLTNQLVVIPSAPTTVPQNNGGGGGGSGGSAGSGAGGGGQYLPSVTIINSCAQIVNFTQLDRVTFTLDGQQFNVVENYITPTSAGITINGDSYTISNGNGISLDTNSSFSATLKGISYLPIIQTITLSICGPITTSVTTTVLSTTTVQPIIIINNTVNISKNKSSTFSFTNLNVTVSTNSTINTKSHVTVTNVTLSTPPAPANFTKLYAYNITATNSTNLTILLHYNCAYTNPRPFELVNGAWNAISVYTINSTTCTITFTIPSDPIFAIFSPSNSTATTPTTPTTTTASTVTPIQPSNAEYIYAIVVVIAIAAIAMYLISRRKKRMQKGKRSRVDW